MHHFFIRPENILDDTTLVIMGDDVNHITRSLRLKIGEQVTLSAGQGIDYLVELQEFKADEVVCRLLEKVSSSAEPKVQVTLFQGLPKSDKLDLIVQKCTELGIHTITPVEMSRTIVKLDDKKADKRVERWQKIAEEAAKQSGRGKIPVVGNLLGWKELLNLLKKEHFDLVLVPWEKAQDNSLKQVLGRFRSVVKSSELEPSISTSLKGVDHGTTNVGSNNISLKNTGISAETSTNSGSANQSASGSSVSRPLATGSTTTGNAITRIAYVIGPEGGISEDEVQALIGVGAEPVTLGPRILRTETAGFAVLTVLMYEFNEMEGCDRR